MMPKKNIVQPVRKLDFCVAIVLALLMTTGVVVLTTAWMIESKIRTEAPALLLARSFTEGKELKVSLTTSALDFAVRVNMANPLNFHAWAIERFAASGKEQDLLLRFATLEQMGWRQTIVLQNRIVLAARQSDTASITMTADALMRREDLLPESIALLNVIEQAPLGRSRILQRLALEPKWKSIYIADFSNLNSVSEALNRQDLILAGRKAGIRFDDDDYQAVARHLWSQGLYENAFSTIKYSAAYKPNNILLDGRMTRVRNVESASAGLDPFEWALFMSNSMPMVDRGDGDAFSIAFRNAGDIATLMQPVYWDPRIRTASLTLEGVGLDNREHMQILATLRCSNREYKLSNFVNVRDQLYQAQLSSRPDCSNPVLEISFLAGRSDWFGGATELEPNVQVSAVRLDGSW